MGWFAEAFGNTARDKIIGASTNALTHLLLIKDSSGADQKVLGHLGAPP